MNYSLGQTILILVVYALAVMRLVRLVNYDTVLDPLRLAVERRVVTARTNAEQTEQRSDDNEATVQHFRRRQAQWSTLAYFLGCPWCVGFWISLATAIVPVLIIGWPRWALVGVALATSHLVGLAAPLSADEDMEIVANGE